MSWFKVDDQLPAHEKWAPLSWAAKGLWVHAGAWCASRLNDGHVPAKMLLAWHVSEELPAELVEAGLWEAGFGEFIFHDWLTHNPPGEQVRADRKADAERKARGRAVQRESRRTDAGLQAESSGPVPVPVPVPRREEFNDVTHAGATAALVGRMWWREVIGRDDYDHRASKTARIFEAFADKPEVERVAVGRVLQAERSRIGVMKFLTPDHVLAYWPAYVANNPPGRKTGGITQPDTHDEHAAAAAAQARGEPLPWAT